MSSTPKIKKFRLKKSIMKLYQAMKKINLSNLREILAIKQVNTRGHIYRKEIMLDKFQRVLSHITFLPRFPLRLMTQVNLRTK